MNKQDRLLYTTYNTKIVTVTFSLIVAPTASCT